MFSWPTRNYNMYKYYFMPLVKQYSLKACANIYIYFRMGY